MRKPDAEGSALLTLTRQGTFGWQEPRNHLRRTQNITPDCAGFAAPPAQESTRNEDRIGQLNGRDWGVDRQVRTPRNQERISSANGTGRAQIGTA